MLKVCRLTAALMVASLLSADRVAADIPQPQAPEWVNPTLVAAISGTSVQLAWTAAEMTFGGYRVFEDGARVAQVSAATLSATITAVSPNVTHTFLIQAFNV